VPIFALLITSILSAVGALISFSYRMRLNRHKVQRKLEIPLPPPPETPLSPKPIENHPYVTVNGEEPEIPKSFFHSRTFLIIGVSFALLIGVSTYFLMFHG
jgi:hypothetical protein